ncbi:hypothetical protein ACTJIL_04885 [Luteimonas sp. 22616]|uniref:hypothetical protein n=1 Tax=Luteimonas sp. 22616 TaxID=3453951 RepID=UPI003F82EC78
MRKPVLLLLCLLGACFCAQSQTLHQCTGQGGTTAYRSGTCLPGETLVAVREMEADTASASRDHQPATASESRPPRATQSQHPRRAHAKRKSTRLRSKRRKQAVDPCTREKRARDDFQRRRGIKVTMEQLSRWNHRVYDACK